MKTIAIFGILLLAVCNEAFCQSRKTYIYIDGSNLPSDVMLPTEASFIQASPDRKEPTWGLLETKGGDSLIACGPIKQLERGEKTSIYDVKGRRIGLPNHAYAMGTDSIVRTMLTHKPKKCEVISMIFDFCPCGQKGGIEFGKDSITTNTYPPYRMLLEFSVDSAIWINNVSEGAYNLPAVPIETILALDTSKTARYGLALVTEKKIVCDIFLLGPEDHNGLTKRQLYEAYAREVRNRFGFIGEELTLDGEIVKKMILVTTNIPPKSKGYKNQNHDKRVRSHRKGKEPLF